MKQYIYEDTSPRYPTQEAEEKATNDMAYKIALAWERDKSRSAKDKCTA